jgi:hypothetical protein
MAVIHGVVQTRPAGSEREARAGKTERPSRGCDCASCEWRCTAAPVKHQETLGHVHFVRNTEDGVQKLDVTKLSGQVHASQPALGDNALQNSRHRAKSTQNTLQQQT